MTTGGNVIGADGLAALDPLIEAYPFKAYRNYRVLSRKKQDDVLRAELRGALDARGGFGVVTGRAPHGAAAVVRPLPWDSAFFDLSMARLMLIHDGETGRPPIRETIVVDPLTIRFKTAAPYPLLPVDLLRIPVFGLSIATSIASFCGQMLAFVAIPFYLQSRFGYSAVHMGLLITPWPIAVASSLRL